MIAPSHIARRLLVLAILGASALAHGDNLLDIYNQAAQGDPQILAAAAAHRAALEARPQSLAQFLPQVSATGNASRTHYKISNSASAFFPDSLYNFNTNGIVLNLTQAVYHHDYYVQLRQADSRIAQADAIYGAAEQNLIVRSATLYFDALAARDNQSFAHAERDAIARQLEQAKQRFDVGLIAITDVQEAQARYDLATAQAIVADNQLASQDEAVRELTGAQHDTLLGLGQSLPLAVPEPNDQEQWVKTSLAQNLQLSAAQNALKIAQEEISRQRAGHLPSLDLVGSHSFQSYGDAVFGSRDETISAVTLQLNVPLFSGGLVSSRTREAVQLQEQSREQLEQTRRATERQSRDAFRGVTASISSVNALKQAVTSNQTALESAEAGNEVGTRTMIDVLDAQSNLYRAKRDYARARYDYLLDTLRLKQAAGTLSPDDLKQVNGFLTAAAPAAAGN
jgi:outer membrane protein